MTLDNEHLSFITSIAVPDYPRGELTCGIVHFGVGGFHRAHEAMYLDWLISADPGSRNWAICGVRCSRVTRACATPWYRRTACTP